MARSRRGKKLGTDIVVCKCFVGNVLQDSILLNMTMLGYWSILNMYQTSTPVALRIDMLCYQEVTIENIAMQ